MVKEYKWLADTIAYSYFQRFDLSYEDLKDLKQEAYICIWEASKTYKEMKEGRSFKNYASLIINRRLRNLTLFNKVGSNDLELDVNMKSNCDIEVLEMLLDIEKAFTLIKVDNKNVKSEKGKAYLALKLEGLSEYEIANLCNTHQSNVHRAIKRTIKQVQEILNIKECC